MVKRRKTPEDDIFRLAERVFRLGGIIDKETFDLAFDNTIGMPMTGGQDTDLRKDVFKVVVSNHPDEVRSSSLLKDAKGKSFEKDRDKTAKRIVTSQDEYVRQGARNVDLDEYDTKRGKRILKEDFDIAGRIKGKVVFARKTFVTINQKQVPRFRDRLGRFARISRN